MPKMDPATGLKVCSTCRKEKVAKDNFFHVSSTPDKYAYQCKECYPKAAPAGQRVQRDDNGAVIADRVVARTHPLEGQFSSMTHTKDDIRKAEKQSGLPLVGYVEVGGAYVPVLGRKQPDFLDKEP